MRRFRADIFHKVHFVLNSIFFLVVALKQLQKHNIQTAIHSLFLDIFVLLFYI